MFNLDTVTKQVTHDVDLLVKHAYKSRYAMARALVILRSETAREDWYSGTHPKGAAIMLLVDALETKDVRPILAAGAHTIPDIKES